MQRTARCAAAACRAFARRSRSERSTVGKSVTVVVPAFLPLGALVSAAQQCAEPLSTTPLADALVDFGGRRLRISCSGTGNPTVILEAGLGQSSATWNTVQPAVAETTRVCAYDRAGRGESDPDRLQGDDAWNCRPLHGSAPAKTAELAVSLAAEELVSPGRRTGRPAHDRQIAHQIRKPLKVQCFSDS